ncbi:hypothetical protein SCARD494_01154 [Seiridium cardinale]
MTKFDAIEIPEPKELSTTEVFHAACDIFRITEGTVFLEDSFLFASGPLAP